MSGSTRASAAMLVVLGALTACADRMPADTTAADVEAIRALLDDVERTFESGDLDAAMNLFSEDAVIVAQGMPDITGAQAIRATYAAMLDQFTVEADLTTAEIEVAGDLAYERGTYTLKLIDKASGRIAADLENRHVHVLKRQPDGAWRTWRMIVNNTEPAAQ